MLEPTVAHEGVGQILTRRVEGSERSRGANFIDLTDFASRDQHRCPSARPGQRGAVHRRVRAWPHAPGWQGIRRRTWRRRRQQRLGSACLVQSRLGADQAGRGRGSTPAARDDRVLKPEHPGDPTGQWHANVLAVEHENPWFQVLRQGVLRPDGSVGTHFTVQHARPSVGIVVVERGSFLLLRQHRFIVNRFVWAIPSGSVDPGETNLAAAIRELEEETGIRTATCRSLVLLLSELRCQRPDIRSLRC